MQHVFYWLKETPQFLKVKNWMGEKEYFKN